VVAEELTTQSLHCALAASISVLSVGLCVYCVLPW